jgi:hypothetical protein
MYLLARRIEVINRGKVDPPDDEVDPGTDLLQFDSRQAAAGGLFEGHFVAAHQNYLFAFFFEAVELKKRVVKTSLILNK